MLKALAGRYIIKAAAAEVKTKGGIIIADSAQERASEGIVVDAGPGKFMECGLQKIPQLKVGDKALFGKYAGVEVKSDEGEDFLVMSEEEIICQEIKK